MERYFSDGFGAGSLGLALRLVFHSKDQLPARGAHRLCDRHLELPRHTQPVKLVAIDKSRSSISVGCTNPSTDIYFP